MRKHAWAFDLFGIAALGFVFFLASCSTSVPEGVGGPNGAINPMQAAGPCQPQFVQEFQGLRNYTQAEYQPDMVRRACEGFKRKYNGMRCSYDGFDYVNYTNRQYTIDVNSEMDAIINQRMF